MGFLDLIKVTKGEPPSNPLRFALGHGNKGPKNFDLGTFFVPS